MGVPGDDLRTPAGERLAEGAHLGRLVFACHVDDELVDPLSGKVGVGVQLAHGFLRVPGIGDFSLGIAGA